MIKNMEKSECYDENLELSDSEDVFDFQILKDNFEDNVYYDFDTTSSSCSLIIPPKT